ncbi:peroxiredoxin [Actinoplanes sp. NPDC051343]|jgi:peroxiredoxin|uniref:peroxiredoxin n=1 Tax=Actinoplanes sp. NPDC051343 TaxID=3363906 RepID=UPI0037A79510
MPLAVGENAPDFTLKDQNNQDVSLADFKTRKAVLLVFYPLAFTGTCQGELTEIRDSLPRYANDQVQVLTVSVDSTYSHKIWSLQQGFQFPMLADFWPHGGVAQAYNVFDATTGRANRGTFLIDRTGVIRFAEELGPRDPRDQKAWQQALEDLQ